MTVVPSSACSSAIFLSCQHQCARGHTPRSHHLGAVPRYLVHYRRRYGPHFVPGSGWPAWYCGHFDLVLLFFFVYVWEFSQFSPISVAASFPPLGASSYVRSPPCAAPRWVGAEVRGRGVRAGGLC